MSNRQQHSIFWFRRDLRLEDNRALAEACRSSSPVKCIFIFDPYILDRLDDPYDRRVDFIYQQVYRLKTEIEKFGSSLFVYHGNPKSIFERLIRDQNITAVYSHHDFDPYSVSRDKSIKNLCDNHKVLFKSYLDHVVLGPKQVLKSDGTPYTVFTPYSKAWKKIYQRYSYTDERINTERLISCPNQPLIPLEELGFKHTDIEGRVPSLNELERTVLSYDETRDYPGRRTGTTRLGVHLRFGTVSIRRLIGWAHQRNEVFLTELIWREFYQMILYYFPSSIDTEFKSKYRNIPWYYDEDTFSAWKQGRTGYPLVDAGMRELNATGYMHNRVRMLTASFLCKHLLHDWRLGERYFASKLLDYELGSNVGNWQWAASTGCDAAPYFRIFNPNLQQKKFDPQGKYVSRWIPEINNRNYPDPIVVHKKARERALAHYKKYID